jgi:hypothetical protein
MKSNQGARLLPPLFLVPIQQRKPVQQNVRRKCTPITTQKPIQNSHSYATGVTWALHPAHFQSPRKGKRLSYCTIDTHR